VPAGSRPEFVNRAGALTLETVIVVVPLVLGVLVFDASALAFGAALAP
jgi:hypothetical protein